MSESVRDASPPPPASRRDASAARGTVVFSVDAELGWGHHDLLSPPVERVEHARTGWLNLLGLFDEYGIPATWAVVGHLFLDDCDGCHRDHPVPEWWFARERGEWADRPDLRFGGTLIERIDSAGIDHELACHGFSHVEFGAETTSAELAREELRACVEVANRRFESFVFPRNNYGHRAVLADEGFRCYRGPPPGREHVGRVRKVGGGALGRSPPLVVPYTDEYGLVSVPASMYLFDFEGPVRSLLDITVGDPVVRRVRAGVDAAGRTGGLIHLWLHPNNLTLKRDLDRMRDVLEHVARRRSDGHVSVSTMGAVAATIG